GLGKTPAPTMQASRPERERAVATPAPVRPTGVSPKVEQPYRATPANPIVGYGSNVRQATPPPRQGLTKPVPKGQQPRSKGAGKPAKKQGQNPSPQPTP